MPRLTPMRADLASQKAMPVAVAHPTHMHVNVSPGLHII
jgi:hypothetical protein